MGPNSPRSTASPFAPLVLVVDDQPDVRLSFCFMLEANGFRVADVPSAELALWFTARQWVDLILTDIAMPDTDGIALLRMVRTDYPPHPKMIAYTGVAFDQVERAREFADAVLTKPVTGDQLTQTINRLLSPGKGDRTSGPQDRISGPQKRNSDPQGR
jgi:CheY-like chemotaxis protein